MTPETREQLHATRRRTVARSLYANLTQQGFTPAQVVGLANQLLDLVVTDLSAQPVSAK